MRSVAVRLTLEHAAFLRGMTQSSEAAVRLGSTVSETSRKLTRAEAEMARAAEQKAATIRESWDRAGTALTAFGAVTTAALGASVRSAMQWESAWTGVLKTVSGSPAELNALEGSLRGLARTLPATHTEIAAVAEAAGALGVELPAISSFTRTMIDLGETTNLSADQAATAIAQMANVIDPAMLRSGDGVQRLGATLVALGNDGASTEEQILTMGQRISGAGALVGASADEVLALSSALSSMGITAELGGSVASRVLQDLYTTVETGGPRLEQFASVAGMSAAEFARAFEDDPIRALGSFAGGLNGVEAAGGNVVQTLRDLGFVSSEEQRVLLQLKASQDLLTDSLDTAGQAWQSNSALVEEAAKRYDTTEAKVQIAKNAINDAAITVGDALLPVLAEGATAVADLAQSFGDLPGPIQQVLGGLTGVAGAASLAAGAFLLTFPRVLETGRALRDIGAISPRAATGLGRAAAAGLRFGGAAVGILAVGTAIAKVAEANYLERIDTGMGRVARSIAEANQAASASKLDELFTGKDGEAIIRGVDSLSDALDRTFSKSWDQQFNDWGEGLVNSMTGVEGSSQILAGSFERLDRSLADMVSGGQADMAANTFELIAQRAEEAGYSLDQVKTLFPEYADQLAAVDAQQKMAASSAEGMTGATLGTIPATEEAIAALQDWRDMVTEASDAFTGVGDAYQQVVDKNRELAESTAEATASTEDSWEDFYDGTSASMSDWIAKLEEQAAAQEQWKDNILTITEQIRTELPADMHAAADAMVDELIAMGPAGAAALAQFRNASPEERRRLIEAWEGTGDDIASELESARNPVVDVEANAAPARETAEDLLADVNDARGTISIDGDDEPAARRLSSFTTRVNAAEGTVDILGADGRAITTLYNYTTRVNSSNGTVDILGNDAQGRSTVVSLTNWTNRQSGAVRVNANTSGAQAAVDSFVYRNSGQKTIVVNMRVNQAVAGGGRILPGFPTGGRLPGSPPSDPMADNLLGVDESGMPRVRVRSREWVVREPSADYYGDAIMSAINEMRVPREVFTRGLAGGGSPSRTVGHATPAPGYRVGPPTASVDPAALAAALSGMSFTLSIDGEPVRAIASVEAHSAIRTALRK